MNIKCKHIIRSGFQSGYIVQSTQIVRPRSMYAARRSGTNILKHKIDRERERRES